MDEPTANIDSQTDDRIQSIIQKVFGSNVTVITIAHRLNTIIESDKIMVLTHGTVGEFDTPHALLTDRRYGPKGMFRGMVDALGDTAAVRLEAAVKKDL